MNRPITIAGGGLAGLTLGILLRRENVPVRLIEAGDYPRHKVCGEYLSGEGVRVLERLGVLEQLVRAGATRSRAVRFFTARSASSPIDLPEAALCCSRHLLDETLAAEFVRRGGELRTRQRVREPEWNLEGTVRATGRRAAMRVDGWRWFGLKAHARNVSTDGAGLEMHFHPQGYVGMCRIEGDRVNVCGLFRARAGDAPSHAPSHAWLRGEPGSALANRLAGAKWLEDSVCSVGGLRLDSAPLDASEPPSVGDAFSMIPPLTGNGMSLAFESAELAVAPLRRYAANELSWPDCSAEIHRAQRGRFRRRLRFAGWLQRFALRPPATALFVRMAGRWPGLVHAAFGHTR